MPNSSEILVPEAQANQQLYQLVAKDGRVIDTGTKKELTPLMNQLGGRGGVQLVPVPKK